MFFYNFLNDSRNAVLSQNVKVKKETRERNVLSAASYEYMPNFPLAKPAFKITNLPRAAEMMRNSRVVYEKINQAGAMAAEFYAQDILRRCSAIRKLGLKQVERV